MDSLIYWNNLCGNETEYDAFWSPDISLNTNRPDLTRCFQHTVLRWIPAALIILPGTLFLGLYVFTEKKFSWREKSLLNIAKIVLTLLVSVFAATQLIFYVRSMQFSTVAAITSSALNLMGLVMSVTLMHLEYRAGEHTSGLQQCYWTLQLLFSIVYVRSLSLQQQAGEDTSQFIEVTTYIYFALLCLVWLLVLLPDKSVLRANDPDVTNEKTPLLSQDFSPGKDKQHYTKLDKKPPPAPESYCSFILDITYQWFIKFVIKGWRNPISFEDLPDLLSRDKTTTLVPTFERYWARQRSKMSADHKASGASLLWALLCTVRTQFVMYNLMRLCAAFLIFLNPLLLRLLLAYIETGDPYTWKGILIAFFMLLSSNLHVIFIMRFLYYGFNTGMNLRTVVTSTVYRKSLKLSSAARKQTTVGEIVNLMSVDAQKLQDLPSITTVIWTMPLLIIISTYLLWQTVGASALASVAVLAVVMPVNGFWIANKIRQLQGVQMIAKDKRIKVLGEILAGIKVLKLYSWEQSFQSKVSEYREEELKTIALINVLNAISSVVWNNATYLISLAIFASYVLSSPEHILNPDKVFVTFSLVNVLSFPLQLLPQAVNFIGQAAISMKRIEKFLLLEETESDTVNLNPYSEDALCIENADFSWGKDDPPFLEDINLRVKPGELVAVVGQVGSGKSSLVSAILGEMIRFKGRLTIKDTLSYVPQQAWIQNATVKNNILFGQPYDPARYQHVLRVCALQQDLQILLDGDQTEIGEKGINLSGGQKQRVSLARAVYQNSQIYLMDDPLSAVDSHVAKHLFEQVIGPNGILKYKTRLLVTHGITFLPKVDRIVVLKDGRISESGTYQELLQNRGAFAEFLLHYIIENESDEDSDEKAEIRALRTQLSQISDNESIEQTSVISEAMQSTLRKRRQSRRRSTIGSIAKSELDEKKSTKDETPRKLIQQEQSSQGSIKFSVLKNYVKAGGLWLCIGVLLFHLIFLVALILGQLWLTDWSNDPNEVNSTAELNELRDLRLGVYGGLIGTQVFSILLGSIALALATTQAARIYHSRIVQRLFRVPMTFFDTTPLGRIMNRCSKDVDYLDSNIPFMVRSFIYSVNPLIATIFIISYSTPIFLVLVVPVGVLYYLVQKVYMTTARQIRRIDSVRRSPIFAHFDESVTGAISIRAYGKVNEFIRRCDNLMDDSARAWYQNLISMRWLGIIMESMGSFVTFMAAVFAVLQRDSIGAALAGLSVSYSLQISLYMNFVIRSATELETYMVAAERIDEYSNLQTEAEYEIEDTKPDKQWPSTGEVEYTKYATRYRPELDLVLKYLSFKINSKEKIGIVGRTGAGKSSMALSLFRIIEASSGQIIIDGVPIESLGLHNLRSRLTVIPQDPVVFSGSLRFNIDPLSTSSEQELWRALELAHLKSFVQSLPEGLQYECGENGESLSVGQRQLVCLARALLRKSKILVLDEATSGVDLETDDLIQETIRSAFKDCTVITIAHRINTILDYDRVMVMADGEIKELAPPKELLSKHDSMFYAMAKDAGAIRET